MNPTPVLKSAVTITVPVHVAAEEENEIEEVVNDGTEVNISVDSTFVSDEQATPVPPETVAPTVAPTAAAVTASPVFDDGLPEQPVQQVTGQAIRFPCTCNNGQCGCCTGSMLERVRMKACGNISFVPEDFVFDVRLTLNNNTVVRRRVSGNYYLFSRILNFLQITFVINIDVFSASDPPPICFNPRRAPFVRVCLELSNIRIRNGNAFACLDINADIYGFQVYSASFRCFG